MKSKFIINVNELNNDFLNSLKSLFKDKMIQIYIEEFTDIKDETDYILRNDANKKELLDAIHNVKTGKDLISITPQEWDEKYCL